MAWPHSGTDWSYMLDEVEKCYHDIIAAVTRWRTVILVSPDFSRAEEWLKDIPRDRLVTVTIPTNDTWTRDYGPICVETPEGIEALDYKFNGWGLKFAACLDNLVTMGLGNKGLLGCQRINRLSFALEGGSIDCDGEGTLLTTSECLLSPNRNGSTSKEEIEATLKNDLGVERIVWLNHGSLAGDDTDSHIDTLARFAPDALVYAGCTDSSDANYLPLLKMKEEITDLSKRGLLPATLYELPSPPPIIDPDDGIQLPATYANFLAMPEAVIMPSYGCDTDSEAAEILRKAFRREVVAVNCRALIRQHGSLHCATMQLPEGAAKLPY